MSWVTNLSLFRRGEREITNLYIRYIGHENFLYQMSKCAPAVGTREGWPHISQKRKGNKESKKGGYG